MKLTWYFLGVGGCFVNQLHTVGQQKEKLQEHENSLKLFRYGDQKPTSMGLLCLHSGYFSLAISTGQLKWEPCL